MKILELRSKIWYVELVQRGIKVDRTITSLPHLVKHNDSYIQSNAANMLIQLGVKDDIFEFLPSKRWGINSMTVSYFTPSCQVLSI